MPMATIRFAGKPSRLLASITGATFMILVTPSKTKNSTASVLIIRPAQTLDFEICLVEGIIFSFGAERIRQFQIFLKSDARCSRLCDQPTSMPASIGAASGVDLRTCASRVSFVLPPCSVNVAMFRISKSEFSMSGT